MESNNSLMKLRISPPMLQSQVPNLACSVCRDTIPKAINIGSLKEIVSTALKTTLITIET